ncbi:MAG: alpha/beta fold hydrolase [Eubacteriales bacterium]|nr:alpha/beta fold hydrolase [Eubacteriales bacterium]
MAITHEASCRHGEGNRVAVLCVHGILGSPNYFADLLEGLPPDVDYENLLLPGHGGSGRAFCRASMAAWRACVTQAVEALGKKYDRVLLCGHSMGGLLCVEAAQAKPANIAGLFLLAMPLRMRLTPSAVRFGWRMAFGREDPEDPLVQAAYREYSVVQKNPLGYLGFLPRFVELMVQCRRIRRALPTLTLPVIAFCGEQDEYVSPRSLRRWKQVGSAKLTMLPQTRHFYAPAQEREQVRKAFAQAVQALREA